MSLKVDHSSSNQSNNPKSIPLFHKSLRPFLRIYSNQFPKIQKFTGQFLLGRDNHIINFFNCYRCPSHLSVANLSGQNCIQRSVYKAYAVLIAHLFQPLLNKFNRRNDYNKMNPHMIYIPVLWAVIRSPTLHPFHILLSCRF